MKPQHDEAFIRALVDEALNRTPPGGFPELEKRHGLRAGTLFDWVSAYAPAEPAPFSASHFWIGTTVQNEAAFAAYFDHDPAYWSLDDEQIEASATDVTGCGFTRDLGERYLYDPDLLQLIWRPDPVPARELIEESVPPSEAVAQRMLGACIARGVTTANAAFAYADPTQRIRNPLMLFNDLRYLGLFGPARRPTPPTTPRQKKPPDEHPPKAAPRGGVIPGVKAEGFTGTLGGPAVWMERITGYACRNGGSSPDGSDERRSHAAACLAGGDDQQRPAAAPPAQHLAGRASEGRRRHRPDGRDAGLAFDRHPEGRG